jgi:hypothetical protein
MKKYEWLFSRMLPVIVVSTLLLPSCKPKDSDIQESIEASKKATPEMAGVMVSVNDGILTLTGECRDDAAKAVSEKTISMIKGVKQVVDNCTITEEGYAFAQYPSPQ